MDKNFKAGDRVVFNCKYNEVKAGDYATVVGGSYLTLTGKEMIKVKMDKDGTHWDCFAHRVDSLKRRAHPLTKIFQNI